MEYAQIAHFIKIGSTVFFSTVFVITLFYAFWPKNKEEFKRAASLALHDDAPIRDTVDNEIKP